MFTTFGKLLLETENRPSLIYMTTPAQHFSTDGIYHAGLHSEYCITEVWHNYYTNYEKKYIHKGIDVDAIIFYDDAKLGHMHIGYGDCSHYCMPGKPDVVASEVFREIERIQFKKQSPHENESLLSELLKRSTDK